MKRLVLGLIALFLSVVDVSAASRFWVPLAVTGAVSGTGGLCRLTVNDTTNLAASSAVIVAGILGATACDGTTTVTTVVDATHVEVNLAFGLAYTSGGTVAGGNWTSTGTGNWASTTGGAGGQTVPGSADTATFDGSSGGGTVIPNYAINVTSITMGAFTGTLDWSVNNNNVTVGSFSGTGSGTRTLRLGNGTWLVTGTASGIWNMTTITGLTFNANSSTIEFQATTLNGRTTTFGALNYNTIQVDANTSGGTFSYSLGSSNSAANLTISPPNYVTFPISSTMNITTTLSIVGTAANPIYLAAANTGTQTNLSMTSGTQTLQWVGLHDMNFTGGATWKATNSFNLGDNTGITVTAPQAAGSGACILGGWLLWRDFDPIELNDNFPAFLEKAG